MIIGFLGGSASGDSDSGFYMLAMVGFFPLIGAGYIWLFSNNKFEENVDVNYNIKVPTAINDFRKKNYAAIQEILKVAGFINIKCVEISLAKEMIVYSFPLIPNKVSWTIINLSDRIILMNMILPYLC